VSNHLNLIQIQQSSTPNTLTISDLLIRKFTIVYSITILIHNRLQFSVLSIQIKQKYIIFINIFLNIDRKFQPLLSRMNRIQWDNVIIFLFRLPFPKNLQVQANLLIIKPIRKISSNPWLSSYNIVFLGFIVSVEGGKNAIAIVKVIQIIPWRLIRAKSTCLPILIDPCLIYVLQVEIEHRYILHVLGSIWARPH